MQGTGAQENDTFGLLNDAVWILLFVGVTILCSWVASNQDDGGAIAGWVVGAIVSAGIALYFARRALKGQATQDYPAAGQRAGRNYPGWRRYRAPPPPPPPPPGYV